MRVWTASARAESASERRPRRRRKRDDRRTPSSPRPLVPVAHDLSVAGSDIRASEANTTPPALCTMRTMRVIVELRPVFYTLTKHTTPRLTVGHRQR